jgi:hypothetical protein
MNKVVHEHSEPIFNAVSCHLSRLSVVLDDDLRETRRVVLGLQ